MTDSKHMMPLTDARLLIEDAFSRISDITPETKGELPVAVGAALAALDSGTARVAEKMGDAWEVHNWLKEAVLLSFRLRPMAQMGAGAWDKIPLKCADWDAAAHKRADFRAVPGSVVRYPAYIAPKCVLMPSFVNVGAYVGEATMVDTWATVGSCAQIGRGVHISGGAGIGGVLEPVGARPVIVEDECFIGARSEVAEGVIVGKGAVLSMGVYLSASTKIVDRETGEVIQGRVPPYAVVVPGALPSVGGGPSLYCAVIVKRVDAQTRAKTSINELLRG